MRHALGDDMAERAGAAVAPQEVAAGEVGTDRRPPGVGAMAAGAGAAGRVALEDALAQGELLSRRAGGWGQRSHLPSRRRVDYLGRPRIAGVAGRGGCRRGGRGKARDSGAALIGDAPDSAVHVVRNVERAVRRRRKAGRAEGGAAGVLVGAGEAVREDDEVARGLAVGKRLEDDVIALLRQRRAVPGAVEGDEGAALVGLGERRAVVDQESVRRPVAGEGSDGRLLLRADAHRLAAVAAVFGRQDQFLLLAVEIAFGPAEIGALGEN